ncbi:protein of unknown function [Flexibacter flexilis DSM 6793]|uniref:DUF3560 domain-containing protein n=1 Tax=Flexibacter flexilis DSM 6793 TaxID=927664 RepID=A0A1I1NSW5_9BACT|nr:DUF3560 domain-containing protein [Flexibacter flexilis]SFD00506.1 protein of unknown function [Flexibacter flexilis DSM 6793]
MNTYIKYYPNVYLAKCQEPHEKGSTILVTTKYGKENECIVFNLIYQKEGFYFYSIVRADGFNTQERAKNKAERLQNASNNAQKKSDEYYQASQEGRDFLVLGEPIKIGHHSEKRHRALIDRNYNRMRKSVELSDKAESYESRASYWEAKADQINLSMPESIEYYEFKLQQAQQQHAGLKNGTIPRAHSFSLTYAKKDLNNMENNLAIAQKLWGLTPAEQARAAQQEDSYLL